VAVVPAMPITSWPWLVIIASTIEQNMSSSSQMANLMALTVPPGPRAAYCAGAGVAGAGVGAGAAGGGLKSTFGATEIDFSFSTVKFAFSL